MKTVRSSSHFLYMKEEFISTIRDLVKIQSISSKPEKLREIVDYVEKFFLSIPNINVEVFEKNGKFSIVIAFKKTLHPKVVLSAHLDVVDGPDYLFEPRIDGDKMYGRGVCDVKSSVALMMYLMKEFSQKPHQPSLTVVLTTDEEIGGFNGTKYLVEEIGYRADVALIPDSGNGPDEIVLKNKGIAHIKITAKGKSSHGAFPWKGENAIENLLNAIKIIKKDFPDMKKVNESNWVETYNIGKIEGGNSYNQVPDKASVYIDFRLTEKRDAGQLVMDLQKIISDCEITLEMAGDMIYTSPENEYVELYVSITQEHLGVKPKIVSTCGSHDGRFWSAKGIPCIAARPISGNQHEDGEWLDLSSLETLYNIQKEFIEKICFSD